MPGIYSSLIPNSRRRTFPRALGDFQTTIFMLSPPPHAAPAADDQKKRDQKHQKTDRENGDNENCCTQRQRADAKRTPVSTPHGRTSSLPVLDGTVYTESGRMVIEMFSRQACRRSALPHAENDSERRANPPSGFLESRQRQNSTVLQEQCHQVSHFLTIRAKFLQQNTLKNREKQEKS